MIVGSENMLEPQKWGLPAKAWTTFLMCTNCFIVYMGASIYSPSIPAVQEQFHVSRLVAGLPFSLYAAGFGIGPLIYTSICEMPRVGRNLPYILSFIAFLCFSYPAAVAPDFRTLVCLRFFQSLLGSFSLAAGGSTLADLFSHSNLPYVICLWASFFWAGPAVGPLVAYLSIPETGWRWSLWETAWAASPVLLLIVFTQPETSKETLVLRYGTGGDFSEKDIPEDNTLGDKSSSISIFQYFFRPVEIFISDPSVLYADVYMSLCYSIYFSFFEAFPIVFEHHYDFSTQHVGLAFLVIPVGISLGHLTFVIYYRLSLLPRGRENKSSPESVLDASLITLLLIPAGLFIFAFTSKPKIHWVVPLIGVVLYLIGVYCLNQAILSYLAQSHTKYSGSVFAMNQFLRSLFAFGQVLVAVPLYENLGIEKGVCVLGALTAGLSPGMLVLRVWGPKLRSMSRFSQAEKTNHSSKAVNQQGLC